MSALAHEKARCKVVSPVMRCKSVHSTRRRPGRTFGVAFPGQVVSCLEHEVRLCDRPWSPGCPPWGWLAALTGFPSNGPPSHEGSGIGLPLEGLAQLEPVLPVAGVDGRDVRTEPTFSQSPLVERPLSLALGVLPAPLPFNVEDDFPSSHLTKSFWSAG